MAMLRFVKKTAAFNSVRQIPLIALPPLRFPGKYEQHSTVGGVPQVTVEICHFQVKNNCSRDYKYGAEHTG